MSDKPILIASEHAKEFRAFKLAHGNNRLDIRKPTASDSIINSYYVKNNRAVIPVKGFLLADEPWVADFWGATSIPQIHANIREALSSVEVSSVILDISSPGGDSDGIPELAEFITHTKKEKPIVAYAKSMCASAAYWLACACDRIYTSEATFIGSIGVVMFLADSDDMQCITSDISPLKVPEKGDHSEPQMMVNYLGELFFTFCS